MTPGSPLVTDQIGYVDAVPEMLDWGLIHKPKFETFDEIIRQLNTQLKDNPLPGQSAVYMV